jgi:hypothetical protein
MKTRSKKAKGKLLQNKVRDMILEKYPQLDPEEDVKSAIMGESGEDVQLTKKARKLFPFSVECKSLANIAVYKYYEQATANANKGEPLVVIKANRKKPLVLVDLEYFFKELLK